MGDSITGRFPFIINLLEVNELEKFYGISLDNVTEFDYLHFPDGELPDLQIIVDLFVEGQVEHGGVLKFVEVDTGDVRDEVTFGRDEDVSFYGALENSLYLLRQDYIVEAYRENDEY